MFKVKICIDYDYVLEAIYKDVAKFNKIDYDENTDTADLKSIGVAIHKISYPIYANIPVKDETYRIKKVGFFKRVIVPPREVPTVVGDIYKVTKDAVYFRSSSIQYAQAAINAIIEKYFMMYNVNEDALKTYNVNADSILRSITAE